MHEEDSTKVSQQNCQELIRALQEFHLNGRVAVLERSARKAWFPFIIDDQIKSFGSGSRGHWLKDSDLCWLSTECIC